MGTDPVITAPRFRRCREVYWSKTSARDVFVSSNLPSGEFYGHSEEEVPARKRVKDVDGVPTAVTLEAVPVTFRADVVRVDLASVRQNYDAYCRLEGGRGEAERAGASSVVDIDDLFENDLFWTEAGDAKCLMEEALLATRSPVAAVGFKVPVS